MGLLTKALRFLRLIGFRYEGSKGPDYGSYYARLNSGQGKQLTIRTDGLRPPRKKRWVGKAALIGTAVAIVGGGVMAAVMFGDKDNKKAGTVKKQTVQVVPKQEAKQEKKSPDTTEKIVSFVQTKDTLKQAPSVPVQEAVPGPTPVIAQKPPIDNASTSAFYDISQPSALSERGLRMLEEAKRSLDSMMTAKTGEYVKALKETRIATAADSLTARTMAYVDAEAFFKQNFAAQAIRDCPGFTVSAANHVLEIRTIVDPKKDIPKVLKSIAY